MFGGGESERSRVADIGIEADFTCAMIGRRGSARLPPRKTMVRGRWASARVGNSI